MRAILVLFITLLLACSTQSPLEPVPDEVVIERESNKAQLNWGRMLNESEGHGDKSRPIIGECDSQPVPLFPSRAAINHVCPVFGICWQCAGRDSTHTRPPEQGYGYGYIYNTINFGLPGMGAWTD